MQEQIINKTSTTFCTRRKFLINTLMGLGTITLGTFTVSFISSCSNNGPTGPAIDSDILDITITVDISLSENQSLANVGGTLALGSNALDNAGILLYRSSETSVLAYSRYAHIMAVQMALFRVAHLDAPATAANSIHQVYNTT